MVISGLPARLYTFAAAVLFAALPLHSADTNQLDANEGVFTVMAALNAAGYDTGLAGSHPLRQQIRQKLEAANIAVMPELKRFLRDHRRPDPYSDYSQYVSFALSTQGPPFFESRFRANEVPPDVVALEGFAPLMVRFYREANIEKLWAQSQSAIDQVLARYQPSIVQAVQEVHGYLRAPTTGYMGRHFQVYLDLLGPANQVQTRSYKEDAYVLLTPSAEPQSADVRHSYLHFLLDPLAIKFSETVNRKKSLIDIAEGAPALGENYKSDFLLLTTESLIKAIEARLDRPAARPKRVEEALAEGFILTPFFSEALPAYEKQQESMRIYYPDLIAAIDLKNESRRLENVAFMKEKPVRVVKEASVAPPAPQSPGEALLQEAEGYYSAKEYEKARSAYLRVLKESGSASHARAYFGLGRISAFERKPANAQEFFRKTLDSSPDPQTLAAAELYLGRLSMVENPPDTSSARDHFQRAQDVPEASNAVKQAAEQELKKLSPQ